MEQSLILLPISGFLRQLIHQSLIPGIPTAFQSPVDKGRFGGWLRSVPSVRRDARLLVVVVVVLGGDLAVVVRVSEVRRLDDSHRRSDKDNKEREGAIYFLHATPHSRCDSDDGHTIPLQRSQSPPHETKRGGQQRSSNLSPTIANRKPESCQSQNRVYVLLWKYLLLLSDPRNKGISRTDVLSLSKRWISREFLGTREKTKFCTSHYHGGFHIQTAGHHNCFGFLSEEQ